MDDSGLLELIQLIYLGSTTADHILNGGCFDKAIHAHILIYAAICQHIIKHAFIEEELSEMRTFMEKVADEKMVARHTAPIVAEFEQRFEETLKRLADERKNACTLDAVLPHGRCHQDFHQNWTTYRSQRAPVLHCYHDTGHLFSCGAPSNMPRVHGRIVSWWSNSKLHLDTRRPSKVSLPTETTLSVTLAMIGLAPGVTSVLSRDWWRRPSQKVGWAEGGWRIVILATNAGCKPSTTSPMSTNAWRKASQKHGPLHKDLAKTRMKRNTEAIGRALKWFEENNPFDHDRDKQLFVSFSTGFTSTAYGAVNAERAAEVGREMHIKLDGQSVTSTMEMKFKVQALSSLRKIPKVNEKKIHLNSLKLFYRLIIFAQRDMTVETSLQYELTPFTVLRKRIWPSTLLR